MRNTELQRIMQNYMLRNNLNQKELADKLGVTQVTVHKWLSGKNGITRPNAARILALCSPPAIHQQGSGHAVMSVYGDASASSAKDALDALERRVLAEEEICAECKLAFLRMIKEITR